MILQNIIFPDKSICSEKNLYFHAGNDSFLMLDKGGIQIKGGKCIDFFSYFNGFTLEKWLRYTTIQNICCKIQISGRCRALLFQNIIESDTVKKICLCKQELTGDGIQTIVLPIPPSCSQGICSLQIEAIGKTQFFSGSFETKSACKANIRLVIGICTYHREEYVKRTLEVIRKKFFSENDTPLADHIQVIVSDNGQTLNFENAQNNCVHIVKNKNAGGTGGFTRCMIEALTTLSDWRPTHILLMDDDIILEPESLYRTFVVLSYLKKSYQEYVIGGALLRMDIPYIQFANGEGWENGYVRFTKRGYNLKDKQTLLRNEEELPISYNGWWYCCFPITPDMKDSLPLPFFIHVDDMEYCLRHKGKFITLNGIAVWHDSFENRKASSMEYYDIRNTFLCCLIHIPDYSARDIKKRAYRHLIYQMLKYRYADQDLYLLGIEHALQGVQFLKNTDPVSLNAQIAKMGYHERDMRKTLHELKITDIDKSHYNEHFKPWHILGWLLPTKKIVALPMGAPPTASVKAKKVIYFDPATGKGFCTERKHRALYTTIKNCLKARKLISKNFISAAEDIRANWKELTKIDFWRKYLDL